MPITIEHLIDDNAIEDAVALYVEKCTGINCYIEGYEYKRERPRAVLSIVNSTRDGKSWVKKIKGLNIERTYKKSAKVNIDIDFYTETYDEDGVAIKSNSKEYAKKLIDNMEIGLNKEPLENLGLKNVLANQTVVNESLIEDDKFIKMSSVELSFNYFHAFKLIDTDKITTIESPEIVISE
jgi:hypothetical protein